jgi:hypothetical protein
VQKKRERKIEKRKKIAPMWTTAAAQSRNLAPFFNKHHALWRLLEFMKQRLG